MKDNYLLQHIDSVTHIPAIFIHGQQDLVCPLESSYLLTQNWPKAQLRIVPTGGHLAHDPEMISTLVTATDEMAKQLA
ncbi:proline iminopeptidase [Beggiatoa sp. PS]|nr:proline iminopeptidase [Beggiatoa sp. PS]